MNRHKVVCDTISCSEYKKRKNGIKEVVKQKKEEIINEDNEDLTIDNIVKFSLDKKNIRSDRKRKEATKELLIEYLDEKYNVDDL